MGNFDISGGNLTPNSHKYQNAKQDENVQKPKIKRVATAKTRKKSLGVKFAEAFISDDIDSIKRYVIMDVIIPSIKDALADTVIGAVEMMLFGSTKKSSGPRRTVSNGGYYDYGTSSRNRSKQQNEQQTTVKASYRDLVFRSRSEAEETLDALNGCIAEYGAVSVSELLYSVNMSADFTDTKYGWTDLSSARVRHVRDGWLLDIPRAYPLD